MIDVDKCEYEESYYAPDGYTVHYYAYPKDLNETEFYPEEDYGDIFCMCLTLTRYDDGEYGLALSPTVEEDDCLIDVDWRDLHEGVNYTQETVNALLKKIKGDLNEQR